MIRKKYFFSFVFLFILFLQQIISFQQVFAERPKEHETTESAIIENVNILEELDDVSQIDITLSPRNIKDIMASLGYDSEHQTILTAMNIIFKDEQGSIIDQPTIASQIEFSIDFIIPENLREQMQNGDYYDVQLPNNVKVDRIFNISLLDEEGIQYGTAYIGLEGNIHITFNEHIQNISNISGRIEFDAKFDEDLVQEIGDIIIYIPNEEHISEVIVPIKPAINSSISKSGFFDKLMNPDSIFWNVDINKGLDILTDIKIIEVFPNTVTYMNVHVYKVNVDLYGNVIENSEIEIFEPDFQVDVYGNVIILGSSDNAYRLVYETRINENAKATDGSIIKFINKVEMYADEIVSIHASTTLEAKYGKVIDKENTNYDTVSQTFDWTIKYNYNESNIPQSTASITDIFQNPNLKLINDSVKLYKVTFDTDGNGIVHRNQPLKDGIDYDLVQIVNGFKIIFRENVDYAICVEYQTYVDEIVDDTQIYPNSVEIGTGETSSLIGTAEQQNILKDVSNVDLVDKKITWTISINKNHYEMNSWRMKDSLSPGLYLDVDSLKIMNVDTGEELINMIDYQILSAPPTFIIQFKEDYLKTSSEFLITYDTYYRLEDLSSNESDKKVYNTVTSNWTDSQGNPHLSSDYGEVIPNDFDKYSGGKQGSYNAQTKEITWMIQINYSQVEFKNASLIDPISNDQTYVKDSIKIYDYIIDSNTGEPIRGSEIAASRYDQLTIIEPSKENNNTLLINFEDQLTDNYWIEFKTSLERQTIHSNYTNTATFRNELTQDHDLTATVSVTYGDKLILKFGEQDGEGYVWWEVQINPSQSTLKDVEVVDTPSLNQSIDLNSLEIYKTLIDVDGYITKTTETLELGTDYDLSYTQNDNNVWVLKVDFLHEIDTAYILRYRTCIHLEDINEVVSNDVVVHGNNEQIINGNDHSEVIVKISNGNGIIVGKKGSIILQKQSELSDALEGATFRLYDPNGNTIGGLLVTDQNGQIYISNLIYGTYTLKEITPPAGHSINEELYNGIKITLNAELSSGSIIYLNNSPSKVTLTKMNNEGELLQDAEFALEYYIDGKWVRIREDETFISDEEGKIVILGLIIGNYRFIEIKAPNDHILNPVPIEFTITSNNKSQIHELEIGPFINYKESTTIIKTETTKPVEAGDVTNVNFFIFLLVSGSILILYSLENFPIIKTNK